MAVLTELSPRLPVGEKKKKKDNEVNRKTKEVTHDIIAKLRKPNATAVQKSTRTPEQIRKLDVCWDQCPQHSHH